MKTLLLILTLSGIACAQHIAPDQMACYTLARLNQLKAEPSIKKGMSACCTDCTPATSPCSSGGAGSFAMLQGTQWNCPDSTGGGGCTGSLTKPLEQRAVRTVSGTCTDNFIPFCDVRNYGAVGDGTTNNAAAFNAAITACCSGGTIYVPRASQPYVVASTQLNPSESCFFNLVGDGVDVSTIKLTGTFSLCTPPTNDLPSTFCGAFVDTNSGVVEKLTIIGPGSLVRNNGVDSAGIDGVYSANLLREVKIKGFTTGAEFTGDIHDSIFEMNYVSTQSVGKVFGTSFLTANFSHVTGGPSTRRIEGSVITAAPYLVYSTSGGLSPNFVSIENTWGVYGNAGIYTPNGALVGSFWSGSPPTTQSNTDKISAVAVDKAFHVSAVQGTNEIFNGPNPGGWSCQINAVTGKLRIHTTEGADFGLGTTLPPCTTSTGNPENIIFCSAGDTQCVPMTLPTATDSGGTLLLDSNARVYFVDAAGGADITLLSATGSCGGNSDMSGQQVLLIYKSAGPKLVNNSGATQCKMKLAGNVDFTPAAGNTIEFVNDGTAWREISRSTPSL